MAFTPASTTLAGIYENVSFTDTITYKIPADPILLTPEVVCLVRITPLETNPASIAIVSGGITSSIGGYYAGSFPGTSVQYRTKVGQLLTVPSFVQVDRSILAQIVNFTAPTQKTKTFSYLAEAIHPTTLLVVETATYTKVVNNNWDIGKNQLITYVGYTL